jgi:hypothetical protein
MGEREPRKEQIGRGELLYLSHPHSELFSGYGLTTNAGQKDSLVGLLMVDRPRPVDPEWLQSVTDTFGSYQLLPMTASGERGIACRMIIHPQSIPHLQRRPVEPNSLALQEALQPLLEQPPEPAFSLHWDDQDHLWRSEFVIPNELPLLIREIFERTGYGCLATETDIGVVHICHAPDRDIDGFAGKPARAQWQLIEMPTAPLIRLTLHILDRPQDPYRFESFLNVAEEDQLQVLTRLASQEELYLAFYGDWLDHRFTGTIDHGEEQWQQLDEIVLRAQAYWDQLPPERRDYDRAKEEYIWQNP